MLSKLTARKKISFFLLGILLASDVLLVLLGLLDYSPGPRFHPSGGYIVLYHVILLSVSLVLLQKQLLLILTVSLILLLFGGNTFVRRLWSGNMNICNPPGIKSCWL